MLSKTEKTKGFAVVVILIIGGISIEGAALLPSLPLAAPMTRYEVHKNLLMGNSIHLWLAKLLLDLQQKFSFAETFLSKIFFADIFKQNFQLSNLKDGCKITF